MKDYNINKNTLALMPYGKNKTLVFEKHKYYIVNQRVNKLMDESCRYNGSTIEGRAKGTESLTGISYKAPIIVKEEESIIFFPTCSPRLKECSWINAGNISNIYKKNDRCLVEFYNKETLEFDISYNIMNNQLSKSLILEKKFKKRGK
ncbi:MAG: competence protein ComK [bacterium]|nr:competence protein ComK [bacterium]